MEGEAPGKASTAADISDNQLMDGFLPVASSQPYDAYEFGSPKLPQPREAVILHSLDDVEYPGDSKSA